MVNEEWWADNRGGSAGMKRHLLGERGKDGHRTALCGVRADEWTLTDTAHGIECQGCIHERDQ